MQTFGDIGSKVCEKRLQIFAIRTRFWCYDGVEKCKGVSKSVKWEMSLYKEKKSFFLTRNELIWYKWRMVGPKVFGLQLCDFRRFSAKKREVSV